VKEFDMTATTQTSGESPTDTPGGQAFEMKLEVVTIPVSDVERAKRFYAGLGWRLDADFSSGTDYRIVQFTPPGSRCSLHFGKGLTSVAPGSAQRLYLIVSDIVGARAELVGRGVDVSEIVHREGPGEARLTGADPQRRSYASFASFTDPDGNRWVFQEVTTRIAGRVETHETNFTSAAELDRALRRAAMAHGEHERRIGGRDPNWPVWYAQYMVQEQSGQPLPV
jgi:catechol 2,3-dioxygenase-like lactoylglutathione lyase family enzyme